MTGDHGEEDTGDNVVSVPRTIEPTRWHGKRAWVVSGPTVLPDGAVCVSGDVEGGYVYQIWTMPAFRRRSSAALLRLIHLVIS